MKALNHENQQIIKKTIETRMENKLRSNNEVNDFLSKNDHFQEMKRVATNSGDEGQNKVISYLETCQDIRDYLMYSSDLDIKTTDNIVAYNLGRNNVNAWLYVGGFFSNACNFTYHELHLRENIEAYLASPSPQMVLPDFCKN